MNNFVFYSPTEFVFGKDTEIQTGTLAKKYNARKAMLFTVEALLFAADYCNA